MKQKIEAAIEEAVAQLMLALEAADHNAAHVYTNIVERLRAMLERL